MCAAAGRSQRRGPRRRAPVLGGGSVVTAAALLLLLAHAAAATDGCAGPTPQGRRATTTSGSWRWGAACPCWDAMVEDPKLHPSTRGEARRRREERRASRHFCIPNVKVEDDKTQGHFCIYSCPLKGYGAKWHNLTSSGSQISILRVRGPKWHLGTSSRAASVFNSPSNKGNEWELLFGWRKAAKLANRERRKFGGVVP